MADVDLLRSMEETQEALHLFLNNEFDKAREKTRPLAPKSIYHSLGYTGILFLQAVMTFDNADIEAAVAAAKQCLDLCQVYRRHTSITTTLTSSINKAMLRTSSLATGTTGSEEAAKNREYDDLTELEIHAELVYAECLLLRSILTFIQDENLVSFIKGGLKIRACYQSYKECLRIYRRRDWKLEEPDDSKEAKARIKRNSALKMHFDSGVKMGMGAFNVIISLLPPRVMRLLEIAGFSGNKSWGLKQLEEGFLMQESLRSPLCGTILLNYHTLISYVVGTGDGDLDFAEKILEMALEKHPKGALFLFYAGRLQEMRGNLDQAIDKFESSIDSQSLWQQFHHICFWELMWCYAFKGDWLLAMKYAEKLAKESRWSPATYTFHKAAFLIMVDTQLSCKPDSSSGHATSLMQAVPKMTQRIAGKSLPIEKFAVRKVKRYLAQGNYLVLPGYELMYVWNGFAVLGTNASVLIPSVHQRVESTLASLSPSSPFFVEDQSLCLLLSGLCNRYLGKFSEAEANFKKVLNNHKGLKDEMVYILPYATAELGFMHMQMQNYEQARHYFEHAKNHYKGYSLESRLHFRLHSALHKISHILDGFVSPDVVSDNSETNSPQFNYSPDTFTFPSLNDDTLKGSDAIMNDGMAFPFGTPDGTNANLVEEGASSVPQFDDASTSKKTLTSHSSTSSIRSACSECSSEDERLNEWHDCQ